MMNEKEANRVENYLDSDGLLRVWYYIVIALTMGNVDAAIEQYYEETEVQSADVITDFANVERESEAVSCDPVGAKRKTSLPNRMKIRDRFGSVRVVDEDELDIEDVILAYYVYNSLTGDYTTDDGATPVSNNEVFGGFGGGGDFAGGGAGGSWSTDNGTVSAGGSGYNTFTSGTGSLGSDSY